MPTNVRQSPNKNQPRCDPTRARLISSVVAVFAETLSPIWLCRSSTVAHAGACRTMQYEINTAVLVCPVWIEELKIIRDFHRDLAAELAEAGDHAGAVMVR